MYTVSDFKIESEGLSIPEIRIIGGRFDRYEVLRDKYCGYIAGHGQALGDPLCLNNRSFFFEAMNLVSSLFFGYDEQVYLINDIDYTKASLTWCNKYGLPIMPSNNLQLKHVWDPRIPRPVLNTSRFDNFLSGLWQLYNLYRLWESVFNDDLENISKYMYLVGLDGCIKEGNPRFIDDIKESIAKSVSIQAREIEQVIEYDQKNKVYKYVYYCRSHLPVLSFMFATLICSYDYSTDTLKQHVKRCVVCGQMFEGRKNKTHCNSCPRQNEWYHKNKNKPPKNQ